jgi:hypothetical protein
MAVQASASALAADKPFAGVFRGGGRACSGALSVRSKTIEWHSTYSACKSSPYEILEKDLTGKVPRITYLIKQRSKFCKHEVIELQLNAGYAGDPPYWDVMGYPSLEAFQKKELPDWKDSVLPGREVLSCMLLKTK